MIPPTIHGTPYAIHHTPDATVCRISYVKYHTSCALRGRHMSGKTEWFRASQRSGATNVSLAVHHAAHAIHHALNPMNYTPDTIRHIAYPLHYTLYLIYHTPYIIQNEPRAKY